MASEYITLHRRTIELLQAFYRNAADDVFNSAAERAYLEAADDMAQLLQLSVTQSDEPRAENLRNLQYIRRALQGRASSEVALRCLDKTESYVRAGSPNTALVAEEDSTVNGGEPGVVRWLRGRTRYTEA